MVFPSLPIYLDPPNWQQASNQQQEGNDEGGGGYQLYHNNNNNQGQGGGGSIIRAGSSISMGERARLGKIQQQPGPADAGAVLKCPRCESTNTKFCYYNNYSLSQPRHFCKTCRRYWTRGGALRNVPVGGGCRRNKRSSSTNKPSSSSKSAHPLKLPAAGGSSSASANSSSSNGCSTTINNNSDVNNNVLMGGVHLPTTHQFPFLTSSLNQYHHYNNNGDFGSRFGGTNPTSSLVAKNINGNGSAHEFQTGAAGSSSNGGSLCLGTEQWRLHNLQQVHHHHHQQQQQNQQVLQFPFLTNLEPQIGLFQFGSSGGNNNSNNAEAPRFNFGSKAVDSTSVSTGILMPQLNTMIKMETNNGQGQGQGQGLSNLPKNLLSGSGSSNNSDLFWNGSGNNIVNAWSEVPSFTPSPSHLL